MYIQFSCHSNYQVLILTNFNDLSSCLPCCYMTTEKQMHYATISQSVVAWIPKTFKAPAISMHTIMTQLN